jgi:seryl-tRNA synthetase
MIDPRLLRDDLDATAAALARRGGDRSALDELRGLDERRRSLISEVDAARGEQRSASKKIGQAAPDERPALIQAASDLKEKVARLEEELSAAEVEHATAFAGVPNLPHPDAPDGQEGEGVVLRTFGEKRSFEFEPRDHVDLMEAAAPEDFKPPDRRPILTAAAIDGEAVKDPWIGRHGTGWVMIASYVPTPNGTGVDHQQLHGPKDARETCAFPLA